MNLTGRAQALEENGSRKLNRALRFAVGPLGNDATGLAKRPSTKARSCSSGADILFIGIRHGRSKRHPLDYAATLDFEACIHSQRLRRNGEKPILKLMFGTPIRAAERWRGLRFTEFELRQIAAVRKELDAEIRGKTHPVGPVIPPTLFQQICALTAVGRDSSLFGNPSFLVLLRKIPCSPA